MNRICGDCGTIQEAGCYICEAVECDKFVCEDCVVKMFIGRNKVPSNYYCKACVESMAHLFTKEDKN